MNFARPEENLLMLGIRTAPDEHDDLMIERLLQEPLDWDYLLQQTARHKVTSLFWHRLHANEAIPAEIRRQLKSATHRAGLRGVLLTGEFITISRKFRANEISFIPLKGPVLAAQIYEEVALREFSDLDIMVHKTDLPAAFRLLGELGFNVFESDSSSLPYRDSEHEHHTQFLKPKGKILVELHWSLGQSWYSFAGNTDSFWRGADYAPYLGLSLRVPKREDSLLFLCAHGYKHYWSRLAWICDVSQALLMWHDLDWTYIFEEARHSRMYRVLLLGLFLANDTLAAPLPDRVLEAITANSQLFPIGREIQRLLFSDETIATLDMKKYLFHLHMSESLPDKLAYLRYFLARQLTPNSVDKSRVNLPSSLSGLYYLLRVGRLLREYGASVFKALMGRSYFDNP
ncbi:MAG: nucleotidyltransferase family protein [Chloroflexota bacterium]